MSAPASQQHYIVEQLLLRQSKGGALGPLLEPLFDCSGYFLVQAILLAVVRHCSYLEFKPRTLIVLLHTQET